MREINYYGPPGSGKTRKLMTLLEALAQGTSPSRVGVVTYTKAAADEIRERAAKTLGFSGGPREWAVQMPWVGTIHSLAFRRLGVDRKKMIDDEKMAQFCEDEGLPKWTPRGRKTPDEGDIYNLDVGQGEVQIAVWLLSAARHRIIPLDRAIRDLLPNELRVQFGPETLTKTAEKYIAWKHKTKFLDFEDLLELGAGVGLPVRVLICDEAQDNSPLLWKVLDSWGSQNVELRIHAGDPLQSIYLFAGARPDLFLDRGGEWHTIGNSHRFNSSSAEYARKVILRSYFADPRVVDRLKQWEGVGGKAVDGTSFFLGRTHALVSSHSRKLNAEGTPYRYFRGRAPLETNLAGAYRTALRLERGDEIPLSEIAAFHKGMWPSKRAERTRLEERLRHEEYTSVGEETAMAILGRRDTKVRALIEREMPASNYTYLRLIEKREPLDLFRTPKLTIGTIHAAKGKEADEVTVARDWGMVPLRNVYGSNEEGKGEACVAYVAATRHRVRLTLAPGTLGEKPTPYPWPSQNGGS